MGAIAGRPCSFTVAFATAPDVVLDILFDLKLQGLVPVVEGLVGSVAKGLVLAMPTCTVQIGFSFLQLDSIWAWPRYVWLFITNDLVSRRYKVIYICHSFWVKVPF